MSNGTITMTGAEYDALAGKIAALEAELAKLRAGQEPVAWRMWNGKTWRFCYSDAHGKRGWEALYTAPVQSAVPDGFLIVPIQPTEEMRKRAQDYLAAEGMIVSDWLVHTAYTEMLAAAPTDPATVQGDGWIPIIERLPDVEQRLDKPCELEGKPLPPLNITSTVQCFDGTRVFADAIEWLDGGQPMKGVTHWKPLDAAPAAIAAARKGEGE